LEEDADREIEELKEKYEAKLAVEREIGLRLKGTRRRPLSFDPSRRGVRKACVGVLRSFKIAHISGENGIMKKKFNALQKDIDDQKEEIKQLFEQKKELYQTIGSLEKDIAGLKKEIGERDETIGDKEKRIYDLKKKNQVCCLPSNS
jgi:septal ring factor EnvC (AmiA/AmiB activator)